MNQETIIQIIQKLDLKTHPEGGYYSEIYRCPMTINLNSNHSNIRNLGTSIYYLLKSGQVSRLHKLKSDEIWYFHSGSPLRVYLINNEKELNIFTLGNVIEGNNQPQLIIPAGTIFGAEVIHPETYSLISCAVMPGFDFTDFELIERDQLFQFKLKNKEMVSHLV
jgi:uncharacterized protein